MRTALLMFSRRHSMSSHLLLGSTRHAMSDIDKSITRILDSNKSTVYAKDVDSFMRLYDPNVRVFDAWGMWSYQGAPAWQIAVEG
jgi:hypothetical protein